MTTKSRTLYRYELRRKRIPNASIFRHKLNSPDVVCKMLQDEGITNSEREHFCIIHLDSGSQVRGFSVVAMGSGNKCAVDPGSSFREAILNGSSAVILAHNHTSEGAPVPSAQDVSLTERMVDAGKILGIDVIDHVIVSRDGHISLKEQGMMQ